MQLQNLNNEYFDRVVKQALQNKKEKTTKQQSVWKPEYVLEKITMPEFVSSPCYKKKFKIYVTYSTPQGFKTRCIFFGMGDEYVFNKDNDLRIKKFTFKRYQQHRDNPLTSQYWQMLLLQQGQDFVQNCQQIIKSNLKRTWQQTLQKPLPKKDYTKIVSKRNKTMEQRRKQQLLQKQKLQLEQMQKKMKQLMKK